MDPLTKWLPQPFKNIIGRGGGGHYFLNIFFYICWSGHGLTWKYLHSFSSVTICMYTLRTFVSGLDNNAALAQKTGQSEFPVLPNPWWGESFRIFQMSPELVAECTWQLANTSSWQAAIYIHRKPYLSSS